MGDHICVSVGKEQMGTPREEQPQQPLIYAFLKIHADPGSAAAKRVRGRAYTGGKGTLSAQCDLIKLWQTQCKDWHRRCSGLDTDFVPTRLVRIYQDPQKTHLVENPQRGLRYATLSYMRGGDHGIELKLHNIKMLLSAIPEASLNKSNREAIEVARCLGFEYIWIDMLYIVQTDSADWARESRTMAQIYSNSDLTLIAGRSSSSADGFLNMVNLVQLPPAVEIPYSNPIHRELGGTVYVSSSRREEFGPVESRAWCYQERILSTKMVIFGLDQLIYNCQQHTLCEGGWEFAPTTNEENAIIWRNPGIDDEEHRRSLLKHWYRLVENFGVREMWDPFDVFPTMGGIAQLVEKTLDSRYLAGIWEEDLPRGLLWLDRKLDDTNRWPGVSRPVATNPDRPEKVGEVVTRAPSWSWAALLGAKTYRGLQGPIYDELFNDRSRWCIAPTSTNLSSWTP